MNSSNLLSTVKKNSYAAIKIFCFPYAGGSGALFQQWAKYMHPKAEVIVLQLPGRGDKLGEDPYTDMDVLIDDLLPEIIGHLDRPYVFIGYSLGAKIAFELALRLQKIEFPAPLLFVPIASPAPHIPRSDAPIHELPDSEFIARLRSYQGSNDAILDDPEVMKLLMPGLRADFSILERYEFSGAPRLNVKLGLFGGAEDQAVPLVHLRAWAERFSGHTTCKTYPGGHFFFEKSLRPLLEDINDLLENEISCYDL